MVGYSAQGQDFVLGEVNVAWFEAREDHEIGLYEYLNDNESPVSGEKVIRFYDPDVREEACHYGRSYEGGVYYEFNNCDEETYDEFLYLPSNTDEDQLRAWVEEFAKHANRSVDSEMTWEESTYGPHGSVGCYYTLTTDDYGRKVIDIYCGC